MENMHVWVLISWKRGEIQVDRMASIIMILKQNLGERVPMSYQIIILRQGVIGELIPSLT
jgi:hypothetical protein